MRKSAILATVALLALAGCGKGATDNASADQTDAVAPADTVAPADPAAPPPVQNAADEYREGTKILAKWPLEDWYYAGTVMSVKDGRYFVAYRDGDSSWLERSELRKDDISVGSRVFCNWKFLGNYFPGKVVARNGEKIDVAFDDGDFESTSMKCIRTR